jgi:peptide deformylase
MAIAPIRTFPDPLLKTPSRPVEQITPQVARLITDLIETMRHHPRCVGLAAPQVGWNFRVAVVDVTAHPKARSSSGLTILINPTIAIQEGGLIQREGCLSIPDFTANVHRAVRVQVKARDGSGKPWMRWFEGFEAIAMQHEIDHLNGTLFLDRVANLKTDVFRRKTYHFPH